ncbi:thioredoxin domain-containing protein [Candidatus Uhrbacteria bacterium]|nr:thioredoxin domain-containing protein [Candidatus Uhrbacteria bacterium]
MSNKILLLILSLLAVTTLAIFLIVVIPEKVIQKQEIEAVPTKLESPPISFIDPIRGNPNANITIIEYGDFDCPLCKTVESELQAVIAESPNKRRLIWKDAPNVGAHPNSFVAAMAARCAQDQGYFWDMHDKMLELGSSLTADGIKNTAKQIGLDVGIFDNCMSSEVTRPVVQHTLDEAIALDLTGTPTIFINGNLYSGALTREAITFVIDAL